MDIRQIKKGEEIFAARIEKECLETPWSEKQILEMPENSVYLVGVEGEVVCAIASMYCVFGEGQIMNIAVSGNDQRATLTAVFDNLGKGASGAAIECMNVVLNQDKALALDI